MRLRKVGSGRMAYSGRACDGGGRARSGRDARHAGRRVDRAHDHGAGALGNVEPDVAHCRQARLQRHLAANNTANWDLQTHAARPMVAQPGFLPEHGGAGRARSSASARSAGCRPVSASSRARKFRISHGRRRARRRTWSTGWTATRRSSASSRACRARCTCRIPSRSCRATRRSTWCSSSRRPAHDSFEQDGRYPNIDTWAIRSDGGKAIH